jgi:hypothetical protein
MIVDLIKGVIKLVIDVLLLSTGLSLLGVERAGTWTGILGCVYIVIVNRPWGTK